MVKKPKRKLSKYNLHMKREMKAGKTFKQATKSWKKSPAKKTGVKARAKKAVSRAVKTGGRKVGRNGFNQAKLFKLARMAALLGPHAGVWMSQNTPQEKANQSLKMLSGYDMATGQFSWESLMQGYMPLIATTGITMAIPKISGFLRGLL